jgi:predicted ester cyclase
MTAMDPTHFDPGLARERDRVVRAHIDAEQRGDWSAALETFRRPRYELVPTDEVHDGADAVHGFYLESARAFPDLSFETRALYHAGTAVVHEVVFKATQQGAWRRLPATGRPVHYAMLNVFLFEGDGLVCERMYFDLLTPLRQIGIARDPTSTAGRISTVLNHPLTVTRALLRQVLATATG